MDYNKSFEVGCGDTSLMLIKSQNFLYFNESLFIILLALYYLSKTAFNILDWRVNKNYKAIKLLSHHPLNKDSKKTWQR